MRISFALALLFVFPSFSIAQNEKIQEAIEQKLATIRYVQSLRTPTGGFLASVPAPNVRMVPTLRATSAGVRALKYLTGKPTKDTVPEPEKTATFVLSCFDPKSGGFAETAGGKPDVALTAIGVAAAVELDVPKEKFRKAMDYLKENAKTFEEVRIGAAAVEVWGVKDCPFELDTWRKIGTAHGASGLPVDQKDGGARELGSVAAMMIRLNAPIGMQEKKLISDLIRDGQREDGGFGKKGEKASDIESTYRVMRAFYSLKEKPDEVAKLRRFIARHRNTDGGYGVKPGEASTVGGVYYAAIITKWLDELEQQ